MNKVPGQQGNELSSGAGVQAAGPLPSAARVSFVARRPFQHLTETIDPTPRRAPRA